MNNKKITHPLDFGSSKSSKESVDINRWMKSLTNIRTEEQIKLLKNALDFVKQKTDGLLSPFKVPILQHSLMIADLLNHLGLDTPTLVAAILYEGLHYSNFSNFNLKTSKVTSNLTVSDLVPIIDKNVIQIIFDLQKMKAVHPEPHLQFTENLRRLLLAVVEDVRVVLIRLAEHIIEMRLSENIDEQIRIHYAKDAEEIYAPLANRLGVGQFKTELEDLSLRILQPSVYNYLSEIQGEKKEKQEIYLQKVIVILDKALKEQNIKATITGRVKPIYSIWKKMQRKGIGYDEIYDIQGVRILVPTVMDCYAALGIVHSLWQHIPKEFDDYIANPKHNGYQSLHTAVIGPESRTLEIQIRTFEMHEQSELGVASHWRYKEGIGLDSQFEKKLANLRQILKWQEEWVEGSAESLKAEVFRDWIYVLTPKGEVIDLPSNSTVLDFAYRVHTEVGHHCRGAKVNGKLVPLTHSLKSGEKVEILTTREGGPSRDWLNPELGYLNSAKARTKVHQWFKHLDRDKNIEEGRELLERELKRINVHDVNFENLSHQLKCSKVEDMFAGLGNGDIRTNQVLNALQSLVPGVLAKAAPKEKIHITSATLQKAEVTVSGLGNIVCQMARCCKPIPNDDIIGYITIGKGVSVHRSDCSNIMNASPKQQPRLIQVEWAAKTRNLYSADLKIKANDRPGLLSDVTSVFAVNKINVTNIQSKVVHHQNFAIVNLSIEIEGIELLSKILNDLRKIPNIISVERLVK